MNAKSIEPIVLSPEMAATHTLHQNFHDEAQTQLSVQWVTRNSDDQADGRVVWYYPDGGVRQVGVCQDGPVVAWQAFLEDGSLSQTEDAQGDGTYLVTDYEHGKRKRQGLRTANAEGPPVFTGFWTLFIDDKPAYQEQCLPGCSWGSSANPSRPMPDELRAALLEPDIASALAALRRKLLLGSRAETLLNGADDLLKNGFALSAEAAVALAYDPYSWGAAGNPRRAISFLLSIAASALPLVVGRAEELAAANYRLLIGQTIPTAVLLPRLLMATGAALDPKWDPLLVEALSQALHLHEIASLLGETLLTLPVLRREALILATPPNSYRVYEFEWRYVRFVPTPRILELALADIAQLQPFRSEGDRPREAMMVETLSAFGADAAPALIAWLGGPGGQAACRNVVLRALGAIGDASAAPTLLAFADDKLAAAKDAAREALLVLGDSASAVLTAAATGRSKLASWASEALTVLANRRNEEGMPAADRALRALQASLTKEERDRYGAIVETAGQRVHGAWRLTAPGEAIVRAAVQADPVRAFAAFAEFDIVHGFFGFLSRELDKHPGLPAILAALIHDDKAISGLDQTLLGGCPAALDSLGYRFEQRLPRNARDVADYVAQNLPWEGRRLLLACVRHDQAEVRSHAVSGLVRCGVRIVPEVLPLLGRSDDASVLAAAAVLRAIPTTEAGAALFAAVAVAQSSAQVEALGDALAACRISDCGQDEAALAAYLAQRAQESKKSVPRIADLPAVHFRSGKALSPDAVRWLLGALADDSGSEPSSGLAAVRGQLADADAARLLAAIQGSIQGNTLWTIYAVGTLGDDDQLGRLGSVLHDWSRDGWEALVTHAVHALRRSNRGRAFAWLAHWADYVTGPLARECRAALRRLCEDRGLDRETLLDLTTPQARDKEDDAVAAVARRLEAAMIVGRTFSQEHFEAFVMTHPVVRKAATGLVFLDAKGQPAILTAAGFVDGEGTEVTLAAPISIPHPCSLSDQALATLRSRLSALGLVQPFPQVERVFSRNAKAELSALGVQKLPTHTLLRSLKALGYRPGELESRVVTDAYRPLAAGWFLIARHDPIFPKDNKNLDGTRETTLQELSPGKEKVWADPTSALESEALADLRKLLAM